MTSCKIVYDILHDTKKCTMFNSAKDKIPMYQKSNVVYIIKCPGCGEHYFRKTERCLITRLNEHSNNSDQLMFQHFQHGEKFSETMTSIT